MCSLHSHDCEALRKYCLVKLRSGIVQQITHVFNAAIAVGSVFGTVLVLPTRNYCSLMELFDLEHCAKLSVLRLVPTAYSFPGFNNCPRYQVKVRTSPLRFRADLPPKMHVTESFPIPSTAECRLRRCIQF